jgi:dihydropteroate synthase
MLKLRRMFSVRSEKVNKARISHNAIIFKSKTYVCNKCLSHDTQVTSNKSTKTISDELPRFRHNPIDMCFKGKFAINNILVDLLMSFGDEEQCH